MYLIMAAVLVTLTLGFPVQQYFAKVPNAVELAVELNQQPSKGIPSYAKWGRLAIEAVKKKYMHSEVTDYLYIGCKALSPTKSAQIFKIWIKQDTRKFIVYLTITYDIESETILSLKFDETNSTILAYHKWRTLAVNEIRSKYPAAKIISFRPMNCESISPKTASQTFKFWLEQNAASIYVVAKISYDTKTDDVMSITLQEVSH